MTDYSIIAFSIAIVPVVTLIMFVRMTHVIRMGELGLVYLFGVYVASLRPGFNLTSPLAIVRKVVPGTGANSTLGLIAVALSDLDPQSPPGTTLVGERTLHARGQSHIPLGASVTVIDDEQVGVVLVAMDRRSDSGQKGATPPS